MICSVAGFRMENFLLLPVALGFMFLIALFGNSIGTAIGSVLEDVQGFQLIMNFLVTPLFFFFKRAFPGGRASSSSEAASSPESAQLWNRRLEGCAQSRLPVWSSD